MARPAATPACMVLLDLFLKTLIVFSSSNFAVLVLSSTSALPLAASLYQQPAGTCLPPTTRMSVQIINRVGRPA